MVICAGCGCAAAVRKRATAPDAVKRGTGSSTNASVKPLHQAVRPRKGAAGRSALVHAISCAPSAHGRGPIAFAQNPQSAGCVSNPTKNCCEGVRAGAQQATFMCGVWWRQIGTERSLMINAQRANRGSSARSAWRWRRREYEKLGRAGATMTAQRRASLHKYVLSTAAMTKHLDIIEMC